MTVVKQRMTEDEFMRLPDDGHKYELVDGEAKIVPTGFEHDAIGIKLILTLGPHAKGHGLMTMSSAGFRMKDGNIRCPDASFTRKERLPDGKPPKGFADFAPSLAIEIISSSEERADMARKIAEYFDAGAEQVWHLFPETQRLTVFLSPTVKTDYGPDDEITGGDLLPGFRARVSDLFTVE